MNTQHTSGKWKVVQVSKRCTTIQCEPDRTDSRGSYIAEINWDIDGAAVCGPLLEQDMANARLIAAAPELLEALVMAYSFMVTDPKHQGRVILETLKTAIDKATK